MGSSSVQESPIRRLSLLPIIIEEGIEEGNALGGEDRVSEESLINSENRLNKEIIQLYSLTEVETQLDTLDTLNNVNEVNNDLSQRMYHIYERSLKTLRLTHYLINILGILGVVSVISAGDLFFIGASFVATIFLVSGVGLLYLYYGIEKQFYSKKQFYSNRIIYLMGIFSLDSHIFPEPARKIRFENIIIKMIIVDGHDVNALVKPTPRMVEVGIQPVAKTLIEWASFFDLEKVGLYLTMIMNEHNTEEKNREIFRKASEIANGFEILLIE